MVDLLSTRWFAVDWGTSHMRVYAMDADDDVIARGTGPGMGEIAAGAGSRSKAFEEALLSALSRMMETDAVQTRDLPPVVMCGMVGSRQGWQEAGYLSTPQSLDTLHEKVIRVDTRHSGLQDVHIVPGISQSDPPDVMRGEETQLAGFVGQEAQFGLVSGRVCLPGTHSKWAVLERGTLRGFTTYLTGELFDLLSKRSILAHSVGSKTMDRDVFYETVRACAKGKLNLSEALFSIRAKGLLTGEDAAAARGRLSGLLIGSELAVVDLARGERVALIGEKTLCDLYYDALTALGCAPQLYDGETMVLRGLSSVYAKLGSGTEPSRLRGAL